MAEQKQKELRKVRKRKDRKQKQPSFLSRYFFDLLLLGMFLFGIVLIVAGLWLVFSIERELAGTPAGTVENSRNYSFLLLGFMLLLTSSILGGRSLRDHINLQEKWWNTTCPNCGQPELRRTPRKRMDRLIDRAGIPVRRYICKSCHWVGLRIDQGRI